MEGPGMLASKARIDLRDGWPWECIRAMLRISDIWLLFGYVLLIAPSNPQPFRSRPCGVVPGVTCDELVWAMMQGTPGCLRTGHLDVWLSRAAR
eukprot:5027724-Amphidinium_carterae.1